MSRGSGGRDCLDGVPLGMMVVFVRGLVVVVVVVEVEVGGERARPKQVSPGKSIAALPPLLQVLACSVHEKLAIARCSTVGCFLPRLDGL